jgi:hypothetical protein
LEKKSLKNRLRIITYPKFQLTLLIGNFIVTGSIFGSVYFFVNKAFAKLIADGIAAGLDQQHAYFQFLEYQMATINSYIFYSFTLGFVLSSVWMLILSHRLAGPILRLKGYFAQIARGESYPEIKFRQNDFFTDLPPVINEALKTLENKKT